jgi:mRNA-degrading endonuclease RelE of RelBE toxin-antitoxin system
VSYRIHLLPEADRVLGRQRGAVSVALRGVILALADEPRPRQARKIVGTDLYRIRLRIDGDPWRVIYQVREPDQIVVITRVARRTEKTYRRL